MSRLSLRAPARGSKKPPPPRKKGGGPVPMTSPPTPSSEIRTITLGELTIERSSTRPPRAVIRRTKALPIRYAAMSDGLDDLDLIDSNEYGQPLAAARPKWRRVVKETPHHWEPPEGWKFRAPARLIRTRTLRTRTRGLKPCLCGCGAPVTDYFYKGHYSRWREMMNRFADGELLPHRILPENLFERLGPWLRTEQGGLRPSHTYKALRR